MNASTEQTVAVSTSTPSSPPQLPPVRTPDERLDSAQRFRRFVERVSLRAGAWLAARGVPEADRDDVLQDALLQMYLKRESYDPARSSWESWAFGFVGRVVLNYRRGKSSRLERQVVTAIVLLGLHTDNPSPEEEAEAAMTQASLEKCWAKLDNESQAILQANVEGIEMTDVAAALGLSLSAAYARLQSARARLKATFDREQMRKRALGVMVLPLSIDQFIASNTTAAHFSAETMRRVWSRLDRAMSADVAAGKLRDDGTEVERYMGSPNSAPRARLGARILRALGPRALSALTHLAAVAVGAGVTYALVRHAPTHDDTTAEVRATASSVVAHVEYPREPAPTETAVPSTARSPGAVEEPELRADAGAAERTDAGSGPRAAGRDSIAREQALIDLGSTAYQSGHYEDAIEALQEHANRYPRGQYSASRERLFALALIRAGRKPEARRRIERLRHASPGSPLLAELDAAVNANGP